VIRLPTAPPFDGAAHHLEHLVKADKTESTLDAAFSFDDKCDPVPAFRQSLAQSAKEAKAVAVDVFHAPEIKQDRLVRLLQVTVQVLFEPGHRLNVQRTPPTDQSGPTTTRLGRGAQSSSSHVFLLVPSSSTLITPPSALGKRTGGTLLARRFATRENSHGRRRGWDGRK